MSPPHESKAPHLSDEEFARLVGAATPPEPSVVEHLARCPHCLALLREWHSLRSDGLRGGDALPNEWLEAALAVPRPEFRVPAPRRARAVRLAWNLAVASAVAVVVLIGGVRLLDESGLRQGREVIARQLRYDSSGGLIYAPDLVPTPRGTRGNGGTSELDGALARLVGRHDSGRWNADQAFWLVAGYLSLGDLNNAGAFLREASRAFPDDSRLTRLAGILAYKRNEPEVAVSRFEEALRVHRDPATLYNLSVVRFATGDSTGGVRVLEELTREFPDSPIAALPGAAPP